MKSRKSSVAPRRSAVTTTAEKKTDGGQMAHVPTGFLSAARAWKVVAGGLLLMGGIVFFRFLTFKDVFLFKDIGSDTVNQIYPYARMVADAWRESGFPGWSFRQGMGQYIVPFNTGSPFPYLLYLVGGNGIPYAMAWVEWLKFTLAGLVLYAYLRTCGFGTLASSVGALCYGYCGYMTIGSGWFTFFTAWPIQTAFLLFSLERLYRRKEWLWLPPAVTFIAADQPFNLLLLAEFSLIYWLVRLAADNHSGWSQKAFFGGKSLLMSLLGLLISAFFLLANLYVIQNSPRVSGGASYVDLLSAKPVFEPVDRLQFSTALLRFLGNDLMGTGNQYRGWMNYMEGPTFYVGLLSLLLMPQVFWLSNRRQRIVYGLLTGLIGLTLVFPYFRYLFWAFSGDYYRLLALFIGMAILLAGVRTLDALAQGQRLNLLLLLISAFFWLVVLFFPYAVSVDRPLQTVTMLFLLGYMGLLIRMNRQTTIRNQWALLALTALELAFFSYRTLNRRDIVSSKEYESRTGYRDSSLEALDFIRQREKGFYRVEKDYSSGPAMHASLNDGMVQGYRGTSGYTAFNQKHTALFQAGVGIIHPQNEAETRWLPGLRHRPMLMGLASVKYVLSKGVFPYKNAGFDSLTTFQDVRIFQNPYALPFGFTYDQYVSEDRFRAWSLLQKDFGVMRAAVLPTGRFPGLSEVRDSLAPAGITFETFRTLLAQRQQDTLRLSSFSDNHFDGTIALKRPKLLFLSIPLDEGWRAEVDGNDTPTQLVTFGMTGLWLKEGFHRIRIRYEPPYQQTGLLATGLGVLLYLLLALTSLRNKNKTSSSVNSDA